MIASVFKLLKLCFLPALCTQLQPGLPWAPFGGGYQHCHAVPCDILQCHAILPLLRPNLAALELHHCCILCTTAASCRDHCKQLPDARPYDAMQVAERETIWVVDNLEDQARSLQRVVLSCRQQFFNMW